MRRYAETFFRYWLIIVLPIIVLPAATFIVNRHMPKTVLVSADLWVTQNPAGFSNQWESAAQNEADYINEYLQSPSDIGPILQRSATFRQLLRTAPAQAVAEENRLLQSFTITPRGNYLLNVSYSGTDEQLGIDAVNGLITAVQLQQEQSSNLQTQSSIATTQAQLKVDKQQLAQSTQALRDYMNRHGYTVTDLNNADIFDTTLAGLYQQFKTDQTNYLKDQQQLTALRTQSSLPAANTQQATFYVKDAPSAIVTSSRKKILMNVGIALAVALFLSISFIAAKTLFDRSLRYPDEVPAVLDLPLLAVIPYSNSSPRRGKGPTPAIGRAAAQGSLADA